MLNFISKEDLILFEGLTMGKLRKWVTQNQHISDSAPVIVERIEDVFFETHNEAIFLIEGYNYKSQLKFNNEMLLEIKRRAEGKEPEFDMEDPIACINKNLDTLKEQFHRVTNISTNDDESIVLIHSHY